MSLVDVDHFRRCSIVLVDSRPVQATTWTCSPGRSRSPGRWWPSVGTGSPQICRCRPPKRAAAICPLDGDVAKLAAAVGCCSVQRRRDRRDGEAAPGLLINDRHVGGHRVGVEGRLQVGSQGSPGQRRRRGAGAANVRSAVRPSGWHFTRLQGPLVVADGVRGGRTGAVASEQSSGYLDGQGNGAGWVPWRGPRRWRCRRPAGSGTRGWRGFW